MKVDFPDITDLFSLKEGPTASLSLQVRCYVSWLHFIHLLLHQHFSRLNISSEHPSQQTLTTRETPLLWAVPDPLRTDGSSATCSYRCARGIHSSLKRKPSEYGPGVQFNSANGHHAILLHPPPAAFEEAQGATLCSIR